MSQFSNISRALLLIIASAMALSAASYAAAPAAKPNWLLTFTKTARGSYIVGNPDAATHVVEYASYTCPHCAHFEGVDAPLLKQQFIANGKINFELRALLRDPVDMTVAMLARCGSTGRFFGNHKYLMATQKTWIANAKNITQATNAKLAAKDFHGYMNGVFDDMKLAGVVKARGITIPQARKCLADKVGLEQILAMTDDAAQNVGVEVTPTFLINGKIDNSVYDIATFKTRLSGLN